MNLKPIIQFVVGGALVSLTVVANSEEINFGTRVPTTLELINTLSPKKPGEEIKYRGIEIKKDKSQDAAQAVATQPAPDTTQSANAASMQILFAFDSYELTSQAIEQLHPLGMALQSTELTGLSFLVEGHTDAVGTDAYNMTLSEKRAMSIKNHLVRNYEIPSEYLEAVGMGESKLLTPDQPNDGTNRRVRIVGND